MSSTTASVSGNVSTSADPSARPLKPYHIILYGAYGYTGERTARHIAAHGPRDLKWAIAGRRRSDLDRVAASIKELAVAGKTESGPSSLPDVHVADFDKDRAGFDHLVSQSMVFITAVGPYHRLGRAAFEACATAGVHYIDCTGEVPWVLDMVESYGSVAEKSGAIMIPQCGIDSVPADLLTWSLAATAQEEASVGLGEAVNVCTEFSMLPSNGTVATLFSLLDSYSIPFVLRSMTPFALSPVPKSSPRPGLGSILNTLSGVWAYGGYSNLIQTPLTKADGSQVGRSWGLHNRGSFYGPNFSFCGYVQCPSLWKALAVHFGLVLIQALMAIPPLRKLLQKLPVSQPKDTTGNRLTYHAIGTTDPGPEHRPACKVDASFDWAGDGYYLTGLLMAEAAFTLLEMPGQKSDRHPSQDTRPGVMTPSTLGRPYIQRLRRAGVDISARMRDGQ